VSFRPLFLLARSAETNRARHPPFGESQIERCLPTPELGRAQRREAVGISVSSGGF